MNDQVIWLDKLGMDDVDRVGGKNASLGEMISKLSALEVRVPGGFATTANAYRHFLRHGGLSERINAKLADLDITDVVALAEAGAEIRAWVIDTPFPDELLNAITASWASSNSDLLRNLARISHRAAHKTDKASVLLA